MHTARTDHRIKAIATLDDLARLRAEEVADGEPARVNWLPDTLDDAAALGITDVDTLQAVEFYRESPAYSEYSTNRRLRRSDALLLGYDALHLVDQLLSQPLQVIVAGRRGSTDQYETGMALWDMAPNPVDLLVVDGAGHYEMYSVPRYVDQAVARLLAFYDEHL